MVYSRKTKRSIGFIFIIAVGIAIMIGFSTRVANADPCILPDFESADFGNPTNITNPFFTLTPGTAFCYQSDSEDGERNEVTVVKNAMGNPCTLEIAGVPTIVVRDVVRVLNDEDQWIVAEDTFDFYGQANPVDGWNPWGDVWYFGEATKECMNDGNTEGTWNANDANQCGTAANCPTAGEDYCSCGGDPGIVMLADPMPGNCYQQEFLADHAEDVAKILRLNAKVSVPYGEFEECPKTKEWTPLAHGDVEHKYYSDADDVMNNVLTEELHGGRTVRVELVDVQTGLSVADTGYCPTDFKHALDALCSMPDNTPTTNCEFPEQADD